MPGYGEVALVRGLDFLAEHQSAISNNLANASTVGYKRRFSVAQQVTGDFQSMLDLELPSVSYSEGLDFSRGIERPTGENLHISIGEEDRFFRVRARNGTDLYTRLGEMVIDNEGFLATRSGDRYLDEAGLPIAVQGAMSLLISPNGSVSGEVEVEGGEVELTEFGALATYRVPEPGRLRPIGAGLYLDEVAQAATLDRGANIRQGFLEQSNVESLQELINMIVVQREFQATTRALTSLGRIQETFVSAMNR